MLILLYVIGHLNEILTADEGSIKLEDTPEDEGDIVETVPVPHISAGDVVIWSDLASMFDVLWPVEGVELVGVKELKFFLT